MSSVRPSPVVLPLLRRGAVIVGLSWLLAVLSAGTPSLVLEDDAYFYLQIAWNLGTGHGATFDGLHATSGFHLLWMAVLAPLAWLTAFLGFGKTAYVAVASGTALTIAAAATLRSFTALPERLFVLVLCLFCGLTMEGVLLTALLLPLAQAFLGDRRLHASTLAALSALVPLARIDYAWVAPALALLAWRTQADEHGLPWRPVLVGTATGVAAYLSVEYTMSGHWTSVSSAYKADLLREHGVVALVSENLRKTGNQMRYGMLVAMAGLTWLSAQHARTRALLLVGVATVPVLLHSATNLMRDWYFLAPLVLTMCAASHALHGRSRAWPRLLLAQSTGVVTASVVYFALNAGDWQRSRAFVHELNRALPPGAVVYQVDGAGFTAWHLAASVVNGDGLVNAWAYRERWLQNELDTYLQDIGATYVLINDEDPPIEYHGLEIAPDQVATVADSGPMYNQHARLRLLRLDDTRIASRP